MSEIPADVQAFIDTANCAEATQDHGARASAADAALKAWASAYHQVPGADPKDAVQAGQRLEHLQKDAAWRDRYFRGDGATVQEFDRLNEQIAAADAVELAINGVTPPSSVDENSGALPDGTTLRDGAAHLAETYGATGVKEILRGELVTDDGKTPLSLPEAARRIGVAERFLDRINRDADFRKQLLSGSQEHREMLERATATIVAGRAMLDRNR